MNEGVICFDYIGREKIVHIEREKGEIVFAWLLSGKREGTKTKINDQEWSFPYKLKSGSRVYTKTLILTTTRR